jgi:hypothetical protein
LKAPVNQLLPETSGAAIFVLLFKKGVSILVMPFSRWFRLYFCYTPATGQSVME